jgi:hypothetical protein
LALHQRHTGLLTCKGDTAHVLNTALGVHYHVENASPQRIHVCAANTELHRLDVLQLVRGVLLAGEIRRGLAPVHGAVISFGDYGVLLLGSKGAGKTTFALSAISRNRDCCLVTNDKGLLSTASRSMAGLPYAVAIPPGILSHLPKLRQSPERWAGGKLLVWPSEVGSRLMADVRQCVPLREVWACQLDLKAGSVRLATCESGDVRRAALSAARSFEHTLSPQWLYDLLGWTIRRPWLGELLEANWYTVSGNPWGRWMPAPSSLGA